MISHFITSQGLDGPLEVIIHLLRGTSPVFRISSGADCIVNELECAVSEASLELRMK